MVHVHPRPRAKAARTDTRSPELGHVGGEHGHTRPPQARTPPAPRRAACALVSTQKMAVYCSNAPIAYIYMAVYIACTAHAHVTQARAERGARPSAPTPRSGRGQRSERSAPPCLVSLHPPRSAHNHRNLRGGDCRLCKCAGSGLCCRVERNATKACRCAPCTRMCGFYL